MSSYTSTLRYLYGLQSRGMKFGLRNIRTLLRSLGDPHLAYPTLHVAGTNGKGSTSAFLASMFMEAGYTTALYTSPHLVRFTERIKINGIEIPEDRLVDYAGRLHDAIEACQATFFEATTAMAFRYFADEGVDVAVIEAGLGGRLDSTNVLRPLASFITNISLEHTELLGSTVRSIAREKSGIIKKRVPVVVGELVPAAHEVIARVAKIRRAPLTAASRRVRVTPSGSGRVSVTGPSGLRFHVKPGLEGSLQSKNISLAVAGAELLRLKYRGKFPGLTRRAISRGIRNVVRNCGLHGRFELVRSGGRWRVDVAHNPAGMELLASQLRLQRSRPRVAVFGVMADKKYGEMLTFLAGVVKLIVLVRPKTERSAALPALMKASYRLGVGVVKGGSVKRGLAVARRLDPGGVILVTGSHYVAGEALSEFTKS